MWQDIAALTPPLVMCAAFLIGVVFFLRHQMGSKREAKRAARRAAGRPAVLIFPERRYMPNRDNWPNCRFAPSSSSDGHANDVLSADYGELLGPG